MIITIKIINGLEHNLEVEPEQTIMALKHALADQLSIPANQQRIMFKGKSLNDQTSLKECAIGPGTKVHLVVKKDNESNLSKELKLICKKYVHDVDQFAVVFNQELKKLVNEMSLDDIERFDEANLNNSGNNPDATS